MHIDVSSLQERLMLCFRVRAYSSFSAASRPSLVVGFIDFELVQGGN